MRKFSLVLVLSCLLALSAGCAAAPAPFATEKSTASGAPASAPQPQMPQKADSGGSTTNSAAGAGRPEASADFIQTDAKRMIIHTVDLNLVVTDAGAALQSISDLVTATGGYVANSKSWRDNEQLRAQVTVRVPADKMDSSLAAIKKLAVRVDKEQKGGQDVTEEFTDLNAQLTNLEATERELRELMTDVRQRTQKAEDVLTVYRELVQTRGEIERVKGRMQYLNSMTDLATFNIELTPDALYRPVVEQGWRPLQTVKDASRQLVVAMQGLGSAFIWLLIFVVPVVIALAIPIVLLVLFFRWLRRRGRGKGTPQATTTQA